MGVDYEYKFSSESVEDATSLTSEGAAKWTLSFDALGGYNGFMDDPFATFESLEQKVLLVEVQQDDRGMLSILRAALTAREHVPEPAPPKSFWEKVRHFLGFQEEVQEGYIMYRQDDWDAYGRTGTFIDLLKEIWYGWEWGLILAISGGIIGGLTVLYGIYRFFKFIMNGEVQNGKKKWGVTVRNETWSRERGYYLEDVVDEEESGGLLAGNEDIDDGSENEALE